MSQVHITIGQMLNYLPVKFRFWSGTLGPDRWGRNNRTYEDSCAHADFGHKGTETWVCTVSRSGLWPVTKGDWSSRHQALQSEKSPIESHFWTSDIPFHTSSERGLYSC